MTALAPREPFDLNDWRLEAACAGADPDLFFPGRGDNVEPARSFCRRCPVADDCLEYALEHGEKFGIWGGLAERPRREIRRDRRRARARAAP